MKEQSATFAIYYESTQSCKMNVGPDQLWKIAFRLLMQQFVGFFFSENYDEVDWSKGIVFLDKELNTIQPESRPKNRIADVLVMLQLKNGDPLYIFLHIEVQGYFDVDFGLRVHQMSYRIEDKLGHSPVMLSIFTDDDPNFHPKEYYVEKWGTTRRMTFNTYKVMDNPPSTYKDRHNPIAMIMEIVYESTQIKKSSDAEVMKAFVGLAKKLLLMGYPKEYVLLMKSFIEAHVKFGESKNYRIFENKLNNMANYETTEEILSFFNLEKRLEDSQNDVKQARLEVQRERQAAERERRAAKRERQEKERERQEKEHERQEKERERQEKEHERERAVLVLLNKGFEQDVILSVFDITVEDIRAIQEKYKDPKVLEMLLNRNLKN